LRCKSEGSSPIIRIEKFIQNLFQIFLFAAELKAQRFLDPLATITGDLVRVRYFFFPGQPNPKGDLSFFVHDFNTGNGRVELIFVVKRAGHLTGPASSTRRHVIKSHLFLCFHVGIYFPQGKTASHRKKITFLIFLWNHNKLKNLVNTFHRRYPAKDSAKILSDILEKRMSP
jgi:hypothetical protein